MSKFGVPASANGYIVQFVAALLYLFGAVRTNRPQEMALERLDDIELVESGRVFEMIQVKSHLDEGKLTDRATDFWKTIRVWCDLFQQGQIDFASTTLTLLTTRKCAEGSACSMLCFENRDEAKAERILTEIAKERDNATNEPGYKAFLKLTRSQRRQMLVAMRVTDYLGGVDDLENRLRGELSLSALSESQVQIVLDEVLGWWIMRVSSNLRTPGDTIRSSELQEKVRSIMSRLRPESLLISKEIEQYTRAWDSSDETLTFVRQLRLVDAPDSLVLMAVLDYLRLGQQLSEWTRRALLFVDEDDGYSRILIESWRLLFELMRAELPDSTEDTMKKHGFKLFSETVSQDRPIRNECRKPFIMRGFYHRLANDLKVGWHPEFEDRLP